MHPDAEFSIGETYDSIVWRSPGIVMPTLAEVESAEANYIKKLTISAYTVLVEKLLEDTAISRGYKNQYSIISYYNSINPVWRTDAQTYSTWRDNVWDIVIGIYNQVESNQIPAPSQEQFLAQLPVIEWSV